MNYAEWTRAIGQWFFQPDRAGELITLSVDPARLCLVAESVGVSFNGCEPKVDFVKAVREELAHRRANRIERWGVGQLRKNEFPACLGLAAIQVLAVFDMRTQGNFTGVAFWSRLRALLGEPEEYRMPAGLTRSLQVALWRDGLDRWANGAEFQGALWGRLRLTEKREGRYLVDLPFSQALLRFEDLRRLGSVFLERGYQPGEILSPEVLRRDLISPTDFHSKLRPHARRVLDDQLLANPAYEQVASYIEREWDGTGDSAPPSSTRQTLRPKGDESLRAWLYIGRDSTLNGGLVDRNTGRRASGVGIEAIFEGMNGVQARPKGFRPLRGAYLLAVRDDVSRYIVESRYAAPGDEILLLARATSLPVGLQPTELGMVLDVSQLYVPEQGPETVSGEPLTALPSGWVLFHGYVRKILTKEMVAVAPWRDCIRIDEARIRPVGGLQLRHGVWMAGGGPSLQIDGTLADRIWLDGSAYTLSKPFVTPLEFPSLDAPGIHEARIPGERFARIRFHVEEASLGLNRISHRAGWIKLTENAWPKQMPTFPANLEAGQGSLHGAILEGDWQPIARHDERPAATPVAKMVLQLAAKVAHLRNGSFSVAAMGLLRNAAAHRNPLVRYLARVLRSGRSTHRKLGARND